MHAVDDARVPILRRLITWIADRKNRRRDALPRKLHDFPVAKRLSERRKSFEEIREVGHCHESTVAAVYDRRNQNHSRPLQLPQ